MKLGPLCHSRWLTLASRVLRRYVSFDQQSPFHHNAKILAKLIIGVYWKLHIQIKCHNSMLDGPKHLFDEIKAIDSLSFEPDIVAVLRKRIQRNCYFAHPENLLLAMLADEECNIRAKAVMVMSRLLRSTRSGDTNCNTIHAFHLPKLNFSANHYSKLLSFLITLLT